MKISYGLKRVHNLYCLQASELLCNDTVCQASKDVVFENIWIFCYSITSHITQVFPRPLQPSWRAFVAVGLVAALLPLSVLGIFRVGWVNFNPAVTPVPAVSAVIPYTSSNVASSPMALTASVIFSIYISSSIVSSAIYWLAILSLASTSSPLIIPPGESLVWVTTPFVADLPLLHVSSHLKTLPAVVYEEGVIHSVIYY